MGLPSIRIFPSVGELIPSRILKRVLFPQPLEPMMLTNSPSSTENETLSSALKEWFLSEYSTVKFLISILLKLYHLCVMLTDRTLYECSAGSGLLIHTYQNVLLNRYMFCHRDFLLIYFPALLNIRKYYTEVLYHSHSYIRDPQSSFLIQAFPVYRDPDLKNCIRRRLQFLYNQDQCLYTSLYPVWSCPHFPVKIYMP